MTWPIVDGVSLLFLHVSRGKKSIVLDLRTDDGRDDVPRARDATPTRSSKRCDRADSNGAGSASTSCKQGQSEDRVLHDLGLRRDRPVPRHAEPRHRVRRVGRHRAARRSTTTASRTCPSTCRSASTPVRCSARSDCSPACCARGETGEGCQLEIAQSDAAAAIDWLRSETWQRVRAARVGSHRQRGRQLRAARARHRRHGSRRALPVLRDRRTATSCSWRREREFWKNFCDGIGRPDLFEKWPGSQYGDHARGNTELRAILRDEFATKTTAGVARVRARAQHADRAGEHAEDAATTTRSSRTGMPLLPASAGRRRHAADADQVRRRRAADADEGADRRPAHRRRCCATCSVGTTRKSPRRGRPARSGSDGRHTRLP